MVLKKGTMKSALGGRSIEKPELTQLVKSASTLALLMPDTEKAR